MTESKPRVLCVDDEPAVIEGLALTLRRRFDMVGATSAKQALEILAQDRSIAVVMSDMRMPEMDGATFLARACVVAPDAVRVLLTGQADVPSSIAAVNDGHIFRFLTKPCLPPALLACIEAAAAQHRLVMAERVLLEETLLGSFKALTELLALQNPAAFGRASRIRATVTPLASTLALPDRWQVEIAAMASQLGAIGLPAETVDKLYFGRPLSEDEQAAADRAARVAGQILDNIPRLEGVREILAVAVSAAPSTSLAASVLRAAIELDALESQGMSSDTAIGLLRARGDRHDARVLDAVAVLRRIAEEQLVRELHLDQLEVGMTLVDDVFTKAGRLVVARGFEVTARFLAHARNFELKEPIAARLRGER